MTVITISRQLGSGGDELADRVCEILGYQHFDKRLIAQAAREAGLSSQEIIDYSEENHKVRSFLDRLFGVSSVPGLQPRVWKEDPSGMLIPEEVRLSEEMLLELVQKAIISAYRAGRMVIVGRGGQIILQDKRDVLHVRVEAPMEMRIQRVKEGLKQSLHAYDASIDLRRRAQDMIVERDAASADYIKRFYNAAWNDAALYHVVINTGRVSILQAADIIAMLAKELPVRAEEAAEQAH